MLVPIMDAAIRVRKFARAYSDGAAAGEDEAAIKTVMKEARELRS